MPTQRIAQAPRTLLLTIVLEAIAVGVFVVVKALAGVVAEILLGFGG